MNTKGRCNKGTCPKYHLGTSLITANIHSHPCLCAAPAVSQKPPSMQDVQQYLEQAAKNSFQLQAMYQGTQCRRLEGKRQGQLQMCSSLVTSKGNNPMGSHCLTLPADTKSELKHRKSTHRGSGMVLLSARTWRPQHTGTAGHGTCSVCLSRSVIPAKPKTKIMQECAGRAERNN